MDVHGLWGMSIDRLLQLYNEGDYGICKYEIESILEKNEETDEIVELYLVHVLPKCNQVQKAIYYARKENIANKEFILEELYKYEQPLRINWRRILIAVFVLIGIWKTGGFVVSHLRKYIRNLVRKLFRLH